MKRKITRRSFIETTTVLTMGIGAHHTSLGSLARSEVSELVVVKRGFKPVPILVAANASEATRRAADELADYIRKISQVRPDVMSGNHPIPPSAIWVGVHPDFSKAWPDLNPTFSHPEEILLAGNGRHLLIAGRDRILNGRQIECGTANAVYTFLQKHLGVRWLWPGELGEDVLPSENIVLPSFEYRYHPTILRRRIFARAERSPLADDWTRFQRLKLDSLEGPAGGHAYTNWWERFHRDHPDWFALQPDGTRSGYPAPKTAKICLSNPEVWDRWLADAVEAIEKDPTLSMIMAGENDGHSSGVCVCPKCRAWDHPDGAPWTYTWKGSSEKLVATTDRYITYWNHLARKLRERFPDRRNLYVQGLAYGPSTPPPVKAVPADNVIISYVGKFPTIDEATRQPQKAQFSAWSKAAPHIFYRPNLWYWTGGAWGLPDIALKNVSEDFRFLAENHCIGIFIDTAQEHWSTQGPQYYLMAQLTWDPFQDSQAVLSDYYARGFGKSAERIRQYYQLMETAFTAVTVSPKFGPNARDRFNLLKIFQRVYTDELFQAASSIMHEAELLVAGGPEIYRRRVAFVHTGFKYSRLMIANLFLMTRVRESAGKDREAVNRVIGNWKVIKELCDQYGPVALAYGSIMGKMTGSGYMGMMEDYFGPPSEKLLKGGGTGQKKKASDARTDIN
ncbi:MAG: DUF4838 domain-containing protein [Verrucomicrobia bacterium]|nr:DUF4838 domain-containing protein [Verrucomicrobiota bacterium]